MQRGKSVKVKEVIESLCKLLSALGIDSVPGADTFRRAKFNKEDAVDDLWTLLYNILSKAVRWECSCSVTQPHDKSARAGLVSSALWQCGYGAQWLQGGWSLVEEVGSRGLLLALGWVMSSGGLLESLLAETASGLETLAALPGVSLGAAGGGSVEWPRQAEQWERGLRRLQWEQGKLRFLWRSLQAAQQERAALLHQVLSSSSGPSAPDPDPPTGSTGNSKELEQLRTEIRLLEIYLDWKHLEPLFWSWMDSVIDAKLADPSPPSHTDAVAMAPKSAGVEGGCCQGDTERGGLDRLSEMLLMLQVGLRAVRAEQGDHAPPRARHRDVGAVTSSEKAKIQEKVGCRLHDLTEAYASIPASGGYRLRLQEHPAHQPHRPRKSTSCQAGHQGEAQASMVIQELREKEALLLRELERWRRGHREELQELVSGLEGVVLIPPLKR
ncbi:hypothetical protein MATL_G00157390 [Megalops atlanticus]|uniref:Tubulin epsilon and delta complex protein 1 domain-containing protein n=1 Tax=Megalops atlanticus TaxID=7932 RepID=A0A9D3PUY6_MEGAT|nr:hypothetical protein MATL_G00157390 [Megalops atlanticus]